MRINMERRHRDIDGGWAWVVMVAVYAGMIIYCNTLYMSGVLYKELLARFHEGPTVTSLVGASSSGLLCIAAPFAGILINKFSCRVGIMTGGVLSTVGFALSAFVTNLHLMIITAGVLVGLGYSVMSAGLICAVGFYFEKRRDFVISLSFMMVGFAMFSSAPCGLYLLNTQGLRGTFLILAASQAQVCVIAIICGPSVLEKKVHAQKKLVRKEKSEHITNSYFDLMLLKNKSFLSFLFSTATWNFALTVGIMHLPNYVSTLGGSDTDVGILMTSFAVGNIVGRSVGALTVSRFHARSIHVHTVALLASGLITSTFPLYAKAFGGTYVFAIQIGVLCGVPNSMMTPISISFVGASKLPEAYGLAYLFCGFGVTSGPIVIGYIYSIGGSYEYSFIIAGVVLLIGGVFGAVAICCQKSINTDDGLSFVVAEGDQLDQNKTKPVPNGINKYNSTMTCNGSDVEMVSEKGLLLEKETVLIEQDDKECYRLEERKVLNGFS